MELKAIRIKNQARLERMPSDRLLALATCRGAILSYTQVRVRPVAGCIDRGWAVLLMTRQSLLMKFSASCYYFGESLVDELGKDAPPIGLCAASRLAPWSSSAVGDAVCRLLTRCSGPSSRRRRIHTAFGGSMIEQWLPEATVGACKNASNFTACGRRRRRRTTPSP